MSALFISYSTKDRPTAEILFERLIAFGYEKPFWDNHPDAGIPAGSDWEQELYRNLRLCKALIILCSRNWFDSKWCFAELAYAKAMGKELFPIRIDATSELPIELGRRQAIDFSDPDFSQRLRRGLVEAGLGPENDFPWPLDGLDECPYPGLASFEEHHAGVYFGRDDEILELREQLNQMRDRGDPRLLYVVGASGSGKSSLVKAGLLPRITRKEAGRWCVLPIFRWNELRAKGRDWSEQIAIDIQQAWPADHNEKPDWKMLRERYLVSPIRNGLRNDENECAKHNAALSMAAEHFIEDTKDLLVARQQPNATPLLVIDQFEELLTTAEDSRVASLLEFLSQLLSSPRSPWFCIATLRTDFLTVVQTRAQRDARTVDTAIYSLPLMKPDRFYDVIRRPAEKVGITFESDALVDRIVKDTGTNDALPLLAFALRELYGRNDTDKQFTIDKYVNKLGGLEGCLTRVANELFSNAVPFDGEPSATIQRKLLLAFSRHLVRVNEQDDKKEFVRRAAIWSDFEPEVQSRLQRFIDRRLVISRPRDATDPNSERVVEVAHEALFRKWDKLSAWLDERRELLKWRRDVERVRHAEGTSWGGLTRMQFAQSRDWLTQRREELTQEEIGYIEHTRRKSRLMLLAIASTAAILVTIATTAVYQARLAHLRGVEAEGNLVLANQQRDTSVNVIRQTIYTVQDQLEKTPGTFPARQHIVEIVDRAIDDLRDKRLNVDELSHLNAVSKIDSAIIITQSGQSDPTGKSASALAAELLDSAIIQLTDLVERNPKTAQYARDLSWACNKRSDVHMNRGESDAASAILNRGLVFMKRACEIEAVRFAPDLMWSLMKLGDLSDFVARSENQDDVSRRKLWQEAIDWYQRAEKIGLPCEQDGEPSLQHVLASSFDRICDMSLRLRVPMQSKGYADRLIQLRERIQKAQPGNKYAPRYLALAYYKLGNACVDLNEPEKALEQYEKTLRMRQELLKNENGDKELEWAVAESYTGIATTNVLLKNYDKAIPAFQACVDIMRGFANAEPNHVPIAVDLNDRCLRLGDTLLEVGRVKEALVTYRRSLDDLVAFDSRQTSPEFTFEISMLKGRIAKCESSSDVTNDEKKQ